MVDTFDRRGYDGGWAAPNGLDLGSGSTTGYLIFSADESDIDAGVSIDAWQDASHASTDGTTSDGTTNNCKYVNTVSGTKKISLNGGASVTLNTTNIQQNDCTVRWYYTDGSSTSLTNILLYACNGIDPNVAPTSIKIMAFERTTTLINTTTAASGSSWDHTGDGINTLTNALVCSDQDTPSTDHYFYFGLSGSPQAKGTLSALQYRLDFDSQ